MPINLLMTAALAFRNLLDIEYTIEIGRKGKSSKFKIVFDSDDFKHLAGIGKLTDISIHRRASDYIFKMVLSGNLADVTLMSSKYFVNIADRLEGLRNLEYYLDNNMAVFKWDKNTANSTIAADYMLEENIVVKPKVYVFLKDTSSIEESRVVKINEIVCEHGVSIFRTDVDISKGQVKYTLLKNEKLYKSTGRSILLFEFKSKEKSSTM